MTEDMIQDQEELFEGLGSSVDAAKTRAELQSTQLISGKLRVLICCMRDK
jgi:hypothetical protein